MPIQDTTTAPIGFENELWRAVNALHSNMGAAKYKPVNLIKTER
jgi:hypothetical protein